MFQGLSNELPFLLIIGKTKSLFCVFIILLDSKGPSSLGQCRCGIKDLSGDSGCSSKNENCADWRPHPHLGKTSTIQVSSSMQIFRKKKESTKCLWLSKTTPWNLLNVLWLFSKEIKVWWSGLFLSSQGNKKRVCLLVLSP